MGFSDSSIVSKVALIVLPVGALFIIIGLASTSWYSFKNPLSGQALYSYGLWKYCTTSSLLNICVDYATVLDWMHATRALLILGMLAAAAGTCLFVLSILKNDVKVLKIAALIPPFVAGLFTIIGISVFAGKYYDDTTPLLRLYLHLAWSFFLTTIGGVICVVAGILWIVNIIMARN